jgi:putative flippase GtrA
MFRRWIKFNFIGGMGVAVQFIVLSALAGSVGLHYLVATVLAVETAVLHNFVWHERWTWVDRRAAHRSKIVERLVRFHLTNGAFSILSNLVFTAAFVEFLGLHYLFANLLSIAMCSVLNFLVSDRFVFAVPATEVPAATCGYSMSDNRGSCD